MGHRLGDLHDSAGLGINVERLQTMCAAGTVIGVLMLVWEHFDRWDYRRLGE